tara:strand:+ start:1057 stop:1260 length:204 start_codon:yes stop_codon:yes gene_type:complete
MKWIKKTLLRIAREAVEELIDAAIAKASAELIENIDVSDIEPEQREALKAGAVMLRTRISRAVSEGL